MKLKKTELGYLLARPLIPFKNMIDFKRNDSGRTRIYEYAPPPLPQLKPWANQETLLAIAIKHFLKLPDRENNVSCAENI